RPAWDKDDSEDGLPFHLAIVTDSKVPDRNKEYVFLTNAHAAEPCGREGDIRFLEDLLIWRTTDPKHKLDAASGVTGKKKEVTVKELLERTKIYFVDTAPDGWSAGDRGNGGNANSSNYTYGGFNSNRVAFHDGWVFSDNKKLYLNGYTTLTQPESAIVKYFEKVRTDELNGRPFAAAADMHGPLPAGAVLLHEQNNSPERLLRIHDFAERIEQNMEENLGNYITPQGATVYEQVMDAAGGVRDEALRAFTKYIGPMSEKAAYLTLEWAEYATIWDHLDYTVTGTWGGWAAAEAGLGADSISYEVNCTSYAPYSGATQQVFVDNMRAIIETTVVHAATLDQVDYEAPKLDGPIGFYESGARVTDRDGNPSLPPPTPRNPIYGMVDQKPYDVANTDYFRDLREIVSVPVEEIRSGDLTGGLSGLHSFVVADTTVADPGTLADFARSGGTLVLTDSALSMLPSLIGVPVKSIDKGYAYVGYSDLDRNHEWTQGLYDRARQTYDPVGLGYPLLMERDQYWPCDPNGECQKSPTQNSSPIWSVARADWEDAGGVTIGTVDPPQDRSGGAEGQNTNKTSIGTLKLGSGRLVIFGALLPQPSEDFDHWFGLNPYTITIAGQDLLFRAFGAKAPR
ncbi:MAG: M14 family zinc carboxypeptidase, partial [Gaiellales bacterium]